jgi:hypothetical protein
MTRGQPGSPSRAEICASWSSRRSRLGWVETAISLLPASAWTASIGQDGTVQDDCHVAELTGLSTRDGWPKRQRLLVRRTKPSRRHLKKLTDFERSTGWRYQIIATNINRMQGIAGSHQPQ